MAALPPDLAALAAQRRLETQVTAQRTWQMVGGLWQRLDQTDIAGSWDARIGAITGRLVHAGQLAAADGAQQYVTAALESQGIDPDADGVVPVNAFAGTASDGGSLDELLRIPASAADTAVQGGASTQEALAEGEVRLRRIVNTQVGDAGRVPVGVATVAARHADGYVRMLTPPSCARCVILAGKWYAENDGFDRHPNCDCVHVPAVEDYGRDWTTDPHTYFDQLTEVEQNQLFTKAGAAAIREGADIFQVVNVRQKMRSVQMAGRNLKATQIGVTRHSLAGQRLGAGRKRKVIRLTPESIYAIARFDHDELIRLLKLHGYII